MMRLSITFACVLGIAACSGGAARPTVESPTALHGSEMRASLLYDADGHSMPQPYVNARVGTHEARFLIDTGSNTNVIGRWFADEAQLPLTRVPGAATGQAPMSLVDHPLIDIDGFGSVDIDSALVVEVPAIFEELEIAGTLSPQLLVSDRYAVVLDLQGDTLSRVPRESVLDMEGIEGEFMTRTPVGVCDETQRGVLLRTLLVRGSIGGSNVQLALNSGSVQTAIRSAATESPHGPNTVVQLGWVSRTLDVASIEHDDAGRCTWDGYVGRDFLSNCVLTFDQDHVAGRCLP